MIHTGLTNVQACQGIALLKWGVDAKKELNTLILNKIRNRNNFNLTVFWRILTAGKITAQLILCIFMILQNQVVVRFLIKIIPTKTVTPATIIGYHNPANIFPVFTTRLSAINGVNPPNTPLPM